MIKKRAEKSKTNICNNVEYSGVTLQENLALNLHLNSANGLLCKIILTIFQNLY